MVSMVVQPVSARELIAQFSGNELIIGITVAAWLLLVGAGSLAGARIKTERPERALAVAFIAEGLFVLPSVFMMRSARQILSIQAGETVSLPFALIFTTISLVPVCLPIGLQFPFAASLLKGTSSLFKGTSSPFKGSSSLSCDSPGHGTQRAYLIEAFGAFAGGAVFAFLLAGRVPALETSLAVGVLCLMASAVILKSPKLAVLVLVPIAFYASLKGFQPRQDIFRAESKYGEVKVTGIREQKNVYSSGHFLFSYPDTASEESGAHMAMSSHPSPARVLVVGGSPAALREYLKYPIEKLDFVEADRMLIDASLSLFGPEDIAMTRDKRLEIHAEDGRRFVKKTKDTYDLAIISAGGAETAASNRFYTEEFFRELKAVLADGGVVTLSVPTSFGYVAKGLRMSNGAIYGSLRAVFGHTATATEEYGLLIASDSPTERDPEALIKRFEARGVKTKHFHKHIFEDAFSHLQAGTYEEILKKAGGANKDMRPAAYLYNLLLWAGAHGGRPLEAVLSTGFLKASGVAVLVLSALACLRSKRNTLYFSALSTGFSSMSLSMAVMLGFQAKAGYVYEMFGLLCAIFMAGAALGSFAYRATEKPVKGLLSAEALFCLYAVTLALTIGDGTELFYYASGLGAGLITGIGFSALARSAESAMGGTIYGLDLAGAFAGSLIASIIVIPIFGIEAAVFTAALAKAVSLALVALIL